MYGRALMTFGGLWGLSVCSSREEIIVICGSAGVGRNVSERRRRLSFMQGAKYLKPDRAMTGWLRCFLTANATQTSVCIY